MSTKKWSKLLFAMMLVLMLALVACSKDSDAGGDNNEPDNAEEPNNDNGDNNGDNAEEKWVNPGPDEDENFDIDDFESVSKTGEPIDGGDLTYGLVSDTPFAGVLNLNWYEGAPDAEILDWMAEGLLGSDENFVYDDSGMASIEVNDDDNTVTLTIPEDVKWSDGEPFTVEDLVFSYKVLAHPDYTGVRYGSVANVIGLDPESDWRNQDTEGNEDLQKIDLDTDIEGMEVIDEQTIKIEFEALTPSTTAGGMWTYALPEHIFADIPVAEMDESDAVRKNPVGLGPFKVDSIVPGESVTLAKNENYWQGEPALDEVTVKVVDPSNLVKAIESGEIDLAQFNNDLYADNYEMEDVQFLGRTDLNYSYIGFKLGDWDKENEKVNYKPDEMKMGDVKLREAMWYAVDNDAVGKEFYNNLSWGATTLVDPGHKLFHNEEIETPKYDPDKANEILDEAGYEWADGEDFRTDKDGNELVINFAAMSGGAVAEPKAKYYMQAWEKVGLNVQLIDGRLLEFNSFYERVGQYGDDDPEIDIYAGGWGTGSDIDPTGLYGPTETFNFSRYHSDENDEIMADGVSKEAMDLDYRKDVYDGWQEFMAEEIPVFPTTYSAQLYALNKRVVNYDVSYDSEFDLYELGVSE